eukprot:scaffold7101_cov72-Isochrysis_galbana.AAC.1
MVKTGLEAAAGGEGVGALRVARGAAKRAYEGDVVSGGAAADHPVRLHASTVRRGDDRAEQRAPMGEGRGPSRRSRADGGSGGGRGRAE